MPIYALKFFRIELFFTFLNDFNFGLCYSGHQNFEAVFSKLVFRFKKLSFLRT